MKFLIRIYDYLSAHVRLLWLSMVSLSVLFVCLIFNLRFSENISDFLPLGTSDQEALSVYQNISGANRMYILFDNPDDADLTVEAIDHFVDAVRQKDSLSWCADLTAQFDMSSIQEVTDFVYENIPFFLNDEDYTRMDSLLASDGYMEKQLARDMEMLMFPTGGMMVSNITKDPLGLFAPVLSDLQTSNPQMGFEMYDGYIFTPDMSRAVAMMSSPFGNSETEYNSKMLSILHESIEEMEEAFPEVKACVVGGPEIAVGNSTRIKKDSIIAITLSVILIVLLVVYSIGSLRNIMLIFLSIGWGWLFAMAGMSLFSSNVSIIVIGISSVILGIAVNYPLHLIVHISHVPDMRQAVKDIMAPLVIGNITTVSAFLTLIPLKSTALRDLGIFASFLLIGTIIFVLLYLPHLVSIRKAEGRHSKLLDRLSDFSPERHKGLVAAAAIITVVLAFFSPRTEFDSNMSNINYMTDKQREDMQYFQSLLEQSSPEMYETVYVLSSGSDYDEALLKNKEVCRVVDSLNAEGLISGYKGVSRFLAHEAEQQKRLERWNEFVTRHDQELTESLQDAAVKAGFSPMAFEGFFSFLENSRSFSPQSIEYFAPLTDLILSQNVTTVDDLSKSYIVDVLKVRKEDLSEVKSHFEDCFDVPTMNTSLSRNLSDDFNYIGWACSLIVFIFLWFSFGRIELAVIAFLPMAVSWVWILGIMAVTGIKFNIVNVILATFIFGQGDDYTIFMTEGCQHEYKYRRPILSSYKNSILQSALIMFVGIGTLIVSKHPAMKSLAQVTIIGMFSVVLMSYMLPPLFFRMITMKDGAPRRYPLTIGRLFRGEPDDPVMKVRSRYVYKGMDIERTVKRNLRGSADKIGGLDLDGMTSYTFRDEGYGETAILLALTYPEVHIVAQIADDERRRIAEVSAEDFVENIEFTR